MKTIKLFFAALVIALSTSCQKENIEPNNTTSGSEIRLEYERNGLTNINVSYTNTDGDFIEVNLNYSSSSSDWFRVNGVNLPFGVIETNSNLQMYKDYGVWFIAQRFDYNNYLNNGGSPSMKDLALDIRKVDTSKPVSITVGTYPAPFSYGSYAYSNYYLYKDAYLINATFTKQFKYNI